MKAETSSAPTELEAIRQRGDRFTFWFMLAFLFIQLGIIIPAFHPSVTALAIDDSKRQIEILRAELGAQPLEPISRSEPTVMAGTRREFGKAGLKVVTSEQEEVTALIASPSEAQENWVVTPAPQQIESGPPTPTREAKEDKKDPRQELLDLNSRYIELEKEKRARTFSLPVLGVGIDETVVLLLYPAFVAIGLAGILKSRMDYLSALTSHPSDTRPNKLPFWALPIPQRLTRDSLPVWVFWNWLGLSAHLLVIYLVGASLLSPWIRTYFQPESAAVNAILALVTVGFYLATLVKSIQSDLGKRL
ncbi:MAG: hypothetical protein QOH06_3485 [Acidobacteriota bacterium]|jgi:hypothetical protein|nr:hypothetical protein [Acidobacteriota bacterium]